MVLVRMLAQEVQVNLSQGDLVDPKGPRANINFVSEHLKELHVSNFDISLPRLTKPLSTLT